MMKGQKGITLVALVITIIVMLILVGVSVTVALNGGLFTTAETAKDKTNNALGHSGQFKGFCRCWIRNQIKLYG